MNRLSLSLPASPVAAVCFGLHMSSCVRAVSYSGSVRRCQSQYCDLDARTEMGATFEQPGDDDDVDGGMDGVLLDFQKNLNIRGKPQ